MQTSGAGLGAPFLEQGAEKTDAFRPSHFFQRPSKE
jgi:hypothetical protein